MALCNGKVEHWHRACHSVFWCDGDTGEVFSGGALGIVLMAAPGFASGSGYRMGVTFS